MNMDVVEIKAFVPSLDFERSKQFYRDIGFTMASEGGGVAYFHYAHVSFLLQNFYQKELADNLMMHLLVKHVDSWHQHLREADIVGKYGVRLTEPQVQTWRMRDFILSDPAGVLWRIGENIS